MKGKEIRSVMLKREVADFILNACREVHPNEFIALLKGKESKGDIIIEGLELAPISTYGRYFSDFRLDLLPIDFSILGVVHSHPSGSIEPSIEDLNNMFGRVMLIVAAPYLTYDDIVAYDGKGKQIAIRIL